ncbi:hypothetical protein [Cellulomonas sp. URHB0016]
MSCYKVQAAIRYMDASGNYYTSVSAWGPTVTATASTTMVVNRWGHGEFLIGNTVKSDPELKPI